VTYPKLGRSGEAVQMHEGVLQRRGHVLGEEHPDTLRSLNNLALTYARLGRPDEASQMHEQVLEKRRQILREDHPDTLSSVKTWL